MSETIEEIKTAETKTAETKTAETKEYRFEDPETGKEVVLPETIGEVNIKKLIENVIARSNVKAKNQYRDKIAEYENKLSSYEELRSKIDELETKNLSIAEKEKREAEKIKLEADKYKNEFTTMKKAFESEKLSNALYKITAKYPEIIDTQQVVDLFSVRHTPAIINDNGNFEIFAKVEGQDFELAEAFEKFIRSPSNTNLLRNNLSPGAGSSTNSSVKSTQDKTIKRSEFDKLDIYVRGQLMAAGVKVTK